MPNINLNSVDGTCDPLLYLPRSSILSFKTNEVIYGPQNPPNSIFLVLSGKVKISRTMEDGRQVVVNIYQTDEFFGESVFLPGAGAIDLAIPLEPVKAMSWTSIDFEKLSVTNPQLAIGMMKMLVQRSIDFTCRIESFSVDTCTRRLARALVGFADRFGSPQEDGSVRMAPLTHRVLGEYIGTSREIVTQTLNQFRRQGILNYSKDFISLNQVIFQQATGASSQRPE